MNSYSEKFISASYLEREVSPAALGFFKNEFIIETKLFDHPFPCKEYCGE